MGIFFRDPRESLALAIMHGKGEFVPPTPEEIVAMGNTGGLSPELCRKIEESQKRVRELIGEIDHVPRDFNPYNIASQPHEIRNAYKSIVSQLLESGVAKAILALDWLVDRVETGDTSLGLVPGGVQALRDRLSEQKPSFGRFHIFMDKGSGNGIKQGKLQRTPVPEGQTPFIHVGVGDKLYFNISDIISQGIQKRFKSNGHVQKAIGIISQIVQVELRKKWYTQDTDYAIGKWIPKKDASFDINEIYDVIRGLRFDNSPSRDVIDIENGSIFSSAIFSGDDTDLIGVPELYVILIILGYDKSKIHTFLSHRLTDIRNKLQAAQSELEKETQKYSQGKFNPRKSQLKKVVKDLEGFYNELGNVVSEGPGSMDVFFSEKNLGDINLPRDVFEDEFFRGIYAESAKSTRPNLNERAILNFHDFFQGYFTDIKKKLFPSHAERVMFIHATRSDSHEDDKNFEADISDNLKLLAQGGVLLTDGVKESFSGLHRLDIIKRVVEKHNNQQEQIGEKCEVKVLFDDETQKIKSILVLKGGGDMNKLMDGILGENIQMRDLQEISMNISVYIEQELRKCIIGSEGKVHRLKGKHWLIPLMLKEILLRVKMDNTDSVDDDTIRESLDHEIHDFFQEHLDFFSFLEPSVGPLHISQ